MFRDEFYEQEVPVDSEFETDFLREFIEQVRSWIPPEGFSRSELSYFVDGNEIIVNFGILVEESNYSSHFPKLKDWISSLPLVNVDTREFPGAFGYKLVRIVGVYRRGG